MRLTLRTLLAYMDGILSPADHESMTAQIEASEAAGELMHKATDVTRRLRLPAPPLENDPAGFDANSVAEYLDNTLAPSEVDKLQNHCLVSDQHLAEVTSCHHILKLILEGNVKVDPETRRRMYAVPEVADALAKQREAIEAAARAGIAPTVAAGGVVPDGSTAAGSPSADESIHEVPEYLREPPSSKLGRWLPAIAALLVLGATSYMAFRDGGWLRQEGLPKVAVNQGSDSTDDSGEDTSEEDKDALEETKEGVTGDSQDDGSKEVLSGEDETKGGEQESDNADDSDGVQRSDGTSAGEPMEPDQESDTDQVVAKEGSDEPSTEKVKTGSETPPKSITPIGDEEEGEDEAAEPPPEPIVVGDYGSLEQVLLRQQGESSQWSRLPARAEIRTGDHLLALPTYFCAVRFASGLSLELTDGTQVQLGNEHPTEETTVGVELLYGRIVLANTSETELNVPIVVGDLRGTASLGAGAVLAIEAARPFYAGNDPAETLAPISGLFYATTGNLSWQGENPQGDFAIDQPAMWRVQGAFVDSALELREEDEIPWIKGRELLLWEKVASPYVESELSTEGRIWPQLLELSNSKRKEASGLAAISSAHVGSFDPNIKALGDPEQKDQWNEEIRTMRTVMSQSKELANDLREAIRQRLGADFEEDLYKLLCSYTYEELTGGDGDEALPNGPVAQWIEWLGSPHLEYQVLANENLVGMTNLPRVFNPGGLRTGRKNAISRFQGRLNSGEIKVVRQ